MNKNIVDGFDERKVFINNAVDKNKINSKEFKPLDNSFAKMKVSENGVDVKTSERNNVKPVEDTRGSKENFVIRNYNFDHANRPIATNSLTNSISSALNDVKGRFRNK